MAARKKSVKPKVSPKIVKPRVKKVVAKKTARKKTKPKPVLTAPSPTIPVVTPVTNAVPTANYRELHNTPPTNRFKLWLTVGISMAVIVCIWAYSLSQSLFSSSILQDSADQMQLGNFVDNVSDDLDKLQTQTDQFVEQTEGDSIGTTVSDQPSNQALDNLFSDL